MIPLDPLTALGVHLAQIGLGLLAFSGFLRLTR